MSLLKRDENGQAIQGFAPNKIVLVAEEGSLDVTNVLAVRVAYPADYKIGDATQVGTMSGTTVIRKNITSLVFVDETVVEVMD